MPQEHYVLRCFSCEVFQVHIVKKAKKWECKMCGAKQSLIRNYGKGSGKECREHVMKLNELHMSKSDISGQVEDEPFDEGLTEELTKEQQTSNISKKPLISKWAEFLDDPNEEEDNKSDSDNESFLEKVKATKRSFKNVDSNCYENKKMRKEEISVCFDLIEPDLLPTLNNLEDDQFDKPNQKMNENHSVIQSKGIRGPKQSKYSKYLDEDESENNDTLMGDKKRTNIFDTNPDDLDSILDL